MKELADHELKVWLKSSQYIAIKHLAEQDDRGMSQFVRRIIEQYLERVSDEIASNERRDEGANRGATGRSREGAKLWSEVE